MFELPDDRPVVDESAVGFGLLDAEPSEQELAFVARVLEVEAAQAADDAVVAGLPVDSVGGRMARLSRLVGVAGGPELMARAGYARSLRAVHALVAEVLAQDLAVFGRERSRAVGFAEQEVAAALGVTRRTASVRVEDALMMVGGFARTLAVLEAGFVPVASARELARRLAGEPQALRLAAEARVLDTLGARAGFALGSGDLIELAALGSLEPDRVMTVSLGASRARVRDLVARALRELRPEFSTCDDPAAAADPPESQQPTPRTPSGDVEVWPSPRQGYVFIGRETPDAEAVVILDRLEHLARSSKRAGDPRPLGQLRGAWFSGLLRSQPPNTSDTSDTGAPGGLGLVPVPVHLTVHHLGHGGDADDAGDVEPGAADPTVDTDRLGPVSAQTLTDLTHIATQTGGRIQTRRVQIPDCPGHAFDADGAVLDPGPYQVPPTLRQAIQARDRTCRFPGCMVPARSCDLDHTIPHPRGPTCPCDLACLCRGHHLLKTHSGWQLTNHGHGTLTWTSPTGRTYQVGPDSP